MNLPEHPKILVAEDGHVCMSALKHYISEAKIESKCAFFRRGDDCLDKVRQMKINEVDIELLILDNLMPGKTGIQIAEEVRKESGYQPKVVLVTAYTNHRMMRKIAKLDIDLIIEKPMLHSDFQKILQLLNN